MQNYEHLEMTEASEWREPVTAHTGAVKGFLQNSLFDHLSLKTQ